MGTFLDSVIAVSILALIIYYLIEGVWSVHRDRLRRVRAGFRAMVGLDRPTRQYEIRRIERWVQRVQTAMDARDKRIARLEESLDNKVTRPELQDTIRKLDSLTVLVQQHSEVLQDAIVKKNVEDKLKAAGPEFFEANRRQPDEEGV